MKTYKIGGTEFDLIENADDMGTRRFTQLREFIIYKETGTEITSLVQAMRGFIQGFDNDSKSQMLLSLHNYFTGINQVKEGEDPDRLIFSLIVLEKGEDPKVYDKSKAKEKLQRMADLGLAQGEVTRVVENFICVSPQLSGYYSLMSSMREAAQELISKKI